MPESGEIRIWKAVMMRAIDDLNNSEQTEDIYKSWVAMPTKFKFNKINELERVQDSARRWFNSRMVSVGSFSWVCAVLDLDPQATLEGIHG